MQQAIQSHNIPLPPKAKSLPIFGNALDMRGDIARFFVKLYREYGEIVRVKVMQNEIYVLSGIDVNNWFVANQDLFSIREGFQSFEWIWGTQNHIVLQDGEIHNRIRSRIRQAMATSAVTNNFELLREHNHMIIDSWQEGQEIKVWRLFQQFVTEQLTLLVVNKVVPELFPHLRRMITWQLYVDLARAAPAWVLQLPMYQNSVKYVRKFLMDIIEERRQERASNPDDIGRETLVDDLLAAQAEDPEFWTDGALMAALGIPLLAGMDTVASTMSFLFYALLKHPEVLEECYAEVDALYEETGGSFGYNDLRKLKAVPGATHETLRLYPIGASSTRVAKQDIHYNGYLIPAGSFVYIATVVPHFLDEYYPNAETFDIHRDIKAQVKGAFAPFGQGAHTCLGAGFGQAQMLATTVMLLRHVEFELVPSDFEAKIQSAPAPNPGNDFVVRVKRFRQQ